MVRATGAHLNFASGELSPRMRGRIDLPLYQNGLERCENFIVETQGPARFRNGFEFIDYGRNLVSTSQKWTYLVPFTFNDEQSYILEFTDYFFRIYVNGGPSLSPDFIISGITNASSAVVTVTNPHGMVVGQDVYIKDVLGMTEINSSRPYRVTAVTAYTFTINANSTSWGTYTSNGIMNFHGGGITPWTASHLFELKYAQRADTMYMVHRSYAPYKITRVTDYSFTVATYSRTADPFSPTNFPGAVTFYEQRGYFGGTITNPQKVWATKAADFDNFTTGTGATDAFVYDIATKKVNYIHWLEGNNQFLAVGTVGGNQKMSGGGSADAITPTNVSVKPIDYFGSSQVSPIVKDKRIIFVQNGDLKIRSLEYTIDADDYEPLDITKVADHIVTSGVIQLAYTEGNPDIVWAVKNNGELIGLTYDPVEKIFGWHRHSVGGDGKVLSIATLPKPEGAAQLWIAVERTIPGVSPHSDDKIVYIEALSDAVEFPRFADYYTGNLTSDKSSYLAHLYYYQKRSNHLDSSLVYNGEYDSINGLLQIGTVTLGSPYVSGGVTYQDFSCSTPSLDSSWIGREIRENPLNSIYGMIKSECNGRLEITSVASSSSGTAKVLNSMSSSVYPFTTFPGYTISTNKISNLSHMIGEVVDILADGSVHAQKTVDSNGEITLDYQADYVIIGKAYRGTIVTNNIEVGGVTGIAQTKPKNIARIGIRFLDSLGVSYGADPYKLESLNFRTTSSYTNRPPELFTGDKQVHFPDSWDREKKIVIRQDRQLPCTVQMLVPVVNTSDE